LTSFVIPLSVVAGWPSIVERASAYYAALLFFEAAAIGLLISLDVLLFYVFWTAALAAMGVITGVGGAERQVAAAMRSFLTTTAGTVLMLAAILVCYHVYQLQTGSPSFDVRHWEGLVLDPRTERSLFLATFAAFAVMIPLVPLHIWLPDTLAQAPSAAGAVAAAILLKVGAYGLVRFTIPLFPEAARALSPTVMSLAVVGTLYGGLAAARASDVKRVLSLCSVSALSLVVLGIFSFQEDAVQGALFQMIAHGLFMGALILVVGMISDRRRTRQVEDWRGLRRAMPRASAFLLVFALAFAGLPGLNGFVGMFLILKGTFEASPAHALGAGLGVALTAAALLRVLWKTFPGGAAGRGPEDLDRREALLLAGLALLIVWMGVAPSGLLRVLSGAAVGG
jgi:NADH-quinone oxidoreductase subunit M